MEGNFRTEERKEEENDPIELQIQEQTAVDENIPVG